MNQTSTNVTPPKPDNPVHQWRITKISMTSLYDRYWKGEHTVSHISDEGSKQGYRGSRTSQTEELLIAVHQCRHFTQFIVSVEGLIGKEAKTVLKVLAARKATKAGNTYSNVTGYMRERLSIVIVSEPPMCASGAPESPDVNNEQYTPPVGGYGRDGPPQILGTKCFSVSKNGFTISRSFHSQSSNLKFEKTMLYPNPHKSHPLQRQSV
jgi:hypothetical protein